VRPGFDLDLLEDGSYTVVPLLHRNLQELGIGDSDVGRLRGIYRHTWSRNQLLLERLGVAIDALTASDVEPLSLGGPIRALRYYGDAGLRPTDIIELLVRPSEHGRALTVLGEFGWKPAREAAHQPQDPAYLVHEDSRLVVRTRALADTGAPDSSLMDAAWKATEEVDLKGRRARVPNPSAELLCIVLDGAVGRPRRNIQWVADATLLLRAAQSEVDWQLVLEEALAASLALRLRDALGYVSEAVEAPVPPEIIAKLHETPTTRRETLAHRLSGSTGVIAGDFPRTTARYLRTTPDRGPIGILAGFPAFLADTWGLGSAWHVPATALSKATAGLRRRRTPADHPRAQP
jgi:hypothetical protein